MSNQASVQFWPTVEDMNKAAIEHDFEFLDSWSAHCAIEIPVNVVIAEEVKASKDQYVRLVWPVWPGWKCEALVYRPYRLVEPARYELMRGMAYVGWAAIAAIFVLAAIWAWGQV